MSAGASVRRRLSVAVLLTSLILPLGPAAPVAAVTGGVVYAPTTQLDYECFPGSWETTATEAWQIAQLPHKKRHGSQSATHTGHGCPSSPGGIMQGVLRPGETYLVSMVIGFKYDTTDKSFVWQFRSASDALLGTSPGQSAPTRL